MKLDSQVSQLNRVGKVLEKKLGRLGIVTVVDLLNYFPFRYEDFSQIVDIKDLQEGLEVTVRGRVELIANKRSSRKRKIITEAIVSDGTDSLRIIWFGQPFITKILKAGDDVFFSGKVKDDMFGLQMVGPGYEKAGQRTSRRTSPALASLVSTSPERRGEYGGASKPALDTTHTARIVPIYPLTAGVTQKQVRFLMKQVIDLSSSMEDWLPDDIQDRVDVMEFSEAIKAIHFPDSQDELRHAERRLKFDELFLLQLRAEMIRQSIKRSKAPEIKFQENEIKTFVDSLPFKLTKDQKIAAWEILQDLEKAEPMNRLLEGDVGSGKTVVAAMALYSSVLNGFQGVLMAPTEILAKQHFSSLCELLGGKVSIGLLSRSERTTNNEQRTSDKEESSSMVDRSSSKKLSKKKMLEKIENGELEIIVGTHALLSDDIGFADLGLVIVDEQHRFGVEQRKKIREKSGNKKTSPHFLSMTATPIPRSFALTVYGDLDLSIIREMPAGRKPVQTRLVDPHQRDKAYRFIREQVSDGRQVFVVCPLIQEKGKEIRDKEIPFISQPAKQNAYLVSPSVEKKSVLAEYEKLSKQIFPDLKISFLHGKMKAKEKDEAMANFVTGETDILVSTSVVEVGVNIPNASVMMIEGAENFGLAQLHQFRGRVGRSGHRSYCFLFTDSDSQKVQERLSFFEKNNSGFDVAEYDLEMRGPGEVYGKAQSGMEQLRLASMRDGELIKLAREVARGIDFEKYPELREKVEEWEDSVHLE